MKIKDTDYLYLSSRIKGIQKKMLGTEGLRRLASSKSDEDAAKLLEEAGFRDIDLKDMKTLEASMDLRRKDTYKILYTYSPSKEIIDVFRLRYDYHNLKSIIKARATGEDPAHYLSDAASIEPSAMMGIMREKTYNKFSDIMKEAVIESEDVLARTKDPQLSDVILDKAYFKEMTLKAKESQSEFLKGYIGLMADLANLRIIVRSKRADKSYDYLKRALVEGGTVKINVGIGEMTGDWLIQKFAGEFLSFASDAAAGALTGEKSMALLDKTCDNALVKYLKKAKLTSFGEAHVIAYLMAFENELVSIRQVMAGRRAGMDEDAIMERLRESYV